MQAASDSYYNPVLDLSSISECEQANNNLNLKEEPLADRKEGGLVLRGTARPSSPLALLPRDIGALPLVKEALLAAANLNSDEQDSFSESEGESQADFADDASRRKGFYLANEAPAANIVTRMVKAWRRYNLPLKFQELVTKLDSCSSTSSTRILLFATLAVAFLFLTAGVLLWRATNVSLRLEHLTNIR